MTRCSQTYTLGCLGALSILRSFKNRVFRWTLVWGVLLLGAAAPAQTPVKFAQVPGIGSCNALAAADFNSDGNLDVACAGDTLTIWLGDGAGHFKESARPYPYLTTLVVAGDFNQDGKVDLVAATTNYGDTSGLILFVPGKGNGAFGEPIPFSEVPLGWLAVAQPFPGGPLNLVGTVVSSSASPATVEVFSSNGDGSFQSPVSLGILTNTNVAVADCNGDGIQDVISIGQPAQSSPLIYVALGRADGSYGPPIATEVPEAHRFVSADFTHDGIPDIAWSDGDGLVVYQGIGNGTFAPGPKTSSRAEDVLLAADLNGDGLPDLVLADMAVALNTGGGAFGTAHWYQTKTGDFAVAGNFRHGSLPDLFVNGQYYQNTGNGHFRAPPEFPAGCTQCALAAGDFNQDGNLDVAVAERNDILFLEGNGEGKFIGVRSSPITPPVTNVYSLAAADFTGDGKLDLAVGAQQSGTGIVLIFPGDGKGAFSSPSVAFSGGSSVYTATAADFNGDGQTDLLVLTRSAIVVRCQTSTGVFITTEQFIGDFRSVTVADFNRDGIPDFASESDVYLGNGDGTFRHSYTLADEWTEVETGDFNGDGIPDLVTFSGLDLALSYWPGLGDGTFGLPLAVSDDNLEIVAVADLNQDGISDIVTEGNAPGLTLFLGRGDGTFAAEPVNVPTPELGNLIPGMFSKGPYPDLAYPNASGQVLILVNTTQ